MILPTTHMFLLLYKNYSSDDDQNEEANIQPSLQRSTKGRSRYRCSELEIPEKKGEVQAERRRSWSSQASIRILCCFQDIANVHQSSQISIGEDLVRHRIQVSALRLNLNCMTSAFDDRSRFSPLGKMKRRIDAKTQIQIPFGKLEAWPLVEEMDVQAATSFSSLVSEVEIIKQRREAARSPVPHQTGVRFMESVARVVGKVARERAMGRDPSSSH
ncbi:hypothetical protein VNO77_19185 [Canavalia gladiata]|uniref:Uncharacterized protein n=1 Tax=Canavalia gladiata TaxID=3824 RepID=A0AAN9QIA3_CANGL